MTHPGMRRPAAVCAAAVLAIVVGGLLVVAHGWTLLALFAYSRGGVAPADTGSFTVMYAVTACRLAVGVLYIWGAVAALSGRTRVVLLFAAVLHLALTGLAIPAGAHGHAFAATALILLDLLGAVPILVLGMLPSNKEFFAAR